MALNGNQILYHTPTPTAGVPLRRAYLIPSPQWSSPRARNLTVVSAANKLSSSRSGKSESKSRKNAVEEEEEEEIKVSDIDRAAAAAIEDGFVMPELPGLEPDFWEGPQWDGFGFFIQYMWALGGVFAVVACGVAVLTYNQGATDFKDTPAYKESIQSRDLLEEPESSKADVFESNPTEEAPALVE